MELVNIALKSILCSSIFFAYYWLSLRNKPVHQFNRFYLLFSVIVSMLLPFLHFEWTTYTANTSSNTIYKILEVIKSKSPGDEIIVKASSSFSMSQILIFLYLLIAFTLLAIMFVRIWNVYRLKKKYTVKKVDNAYIIYTSLDKAPFSFFNLLFWKDNIDMKSYTGKQILRHELTHIHQLHTLDKLLLQIITSLFWINPFFWFIQKELSLIHEFIADEEAIDDNDTEAFAMMLLQTHYGNVFRNVVHPFFQSPVKRRIVMIQQIKKLKHHALRKLLIIPVLGFSSFLVSFEMKEASVVKANEKIVLALDAGHGGNDNGAEGINGISEKELNLKVVNQLAKLSREYNVEVVKTREADEYPTLSERPEIAKKKNADLFISIHINQVADGDKRKLLPFEMIIDERNTHYETSRALASAIASQFTKSNTEAILLQKHLAVLGKAAMPALLLELGNISNEEQMTAINNDKKLEELCRNILSGIVVFQNSK